MDDKAKGKMPTNTPLYSAEPVTEFDIAKAWIEVCELYGIRNEDAPTERDLLNVRDRLGSEMEFLSLSWLRNKVVYLRKATKIKGYRESR
jgi:hypothetical protein